MGIGLTHLPLHKQDARLCQAILSSYFFAVSHSTLILKT